MQSTAKGFNIPYSKYWVGVPFPCERGRSAARVIGCQEARGSRRAAPDLFFVSNFLGAGAPFCRRAQDAVCGARPTTGRAEAAQRHHHP